MSEQKEPRTRAHWPELDQLRGLAAILMVLNHAGVKWLGENAGPLDAALIFAGGLAPVFFFFVTGMGRGVQAAANPHKRAHRDVFRKVALLLLADCVLWISPNQLIGMDFLGFIALSTLAVEAVQSTRYPRVWAALGALFVLGVRFALAPRLHLPEPTTTGQAVARFLLGDRSLSGFSYPPCPWLAFPLVGYLVGHFAQSHADWIRAKRFHVAAASLAAGVAGLLVCVLLRQRGMIFFRWGTLSIAYTGFALAALSCGLSGVLALTATKLGPLFALPGTSSLAVVPIHYLLIHVAMRAWPALAEGGRFLPIVLATIVIALAASRAVDGVISRQARARQDSRRYWLGLAAIALVFTYAAAVSHETARDVCVVVAQLAICALFPLPWPRAQSAV
jgi:uncharacterized membrane protein